MACELYLNKTVKNYAQCDLEKQITLYVILTTLLRYISIYIYNIHILCTLTNYAHVYISVCLSIYLASWLSMKRERLGG